ncbi:MAG: MBL fold metallo-hydrolase [Candidatus Micrarchaeia archaeon]
MDLNKIDNINSILFWIGHASFYIKTKKTTVFIDPFNIGNAIKERADLVLITHAHFDHCSKADLFKVIKPNGKIISSQGCLTKADFNNLEIIEPGYKGEFNDITIEAVPAYNIKSERLNFHPKQNKWVGYVLEAANLKFYHAGDTDFIPEMAKLKGLDIAMLPIGGTYTMDVDEAILASKAIDAKYIIPMHYKNLLGIEKSKLAEEKLKNSITNALIMKEIQEPTYHFN